MATTARTALNFSIDQGANLDRTLTVTTDGTTAYDISGLTLTGQIRKSYESESASATFTTSIVSGTAGTYKIKLANSTTTNLEAGRYVYDVEIALNDSTVEKVHYGIITVNPLSTISLSSAISTTSQIGSDGICMGDSIAEIFYTYGV